MSWWFLIVLVVLLYNGVMTRIIDSLIREEAISLRQAGNTYKSIANKFDVHHTTVIAWFDIAFAEKKRKFRRKWHEANKEKFPLYQRKWRLNEYSENRDDYDFKRKTRLATKEALKNGEIEKGNCYVCGVEKAEAHHPNYENPLEIVWACKKHHGVLHTFNN